jgi:hypothetical protein
MRAVDGNFLFSLHFFPEIDWFCNTGLACIDAGSRFFLFVCIP